jgi:hypothetical protein
MQRTPATPLLAILLLAVLSLDAVAVPAERCETGLESILRWRVTGPQVAIGPSAIRTSVAVIEVALAELDLMPVLWFGTVLSELNGTALDLQAAPPVTDQLRFMRVLPATNIAVGRMVPGACLAEVYEAMVSSQTAVFLGGPRFVTADGGTAQARQQVFSKSITGFRPDQDDAYPLHGAADSRIRLQTSTRANTTVQLRIDALIKRDLAAETDVLFQAAASIESNGILVLAKRAAPVRVAFQNVHRGEKVVLLFVHSRSVM